jgi:hypothetical protein
VDYFHLFYEYFEEKVSDFLFVKSGSVIIFFWHNLGTIIFLAQLFFSGTNEGSHDSSYKCFGRLSHV